MTSPDRLRPPAARLLPARFLRTPLLLAGAVLGLLLFPLPVSTRFSASLHPIAHVALGALLAWVFAALLARRRPHSGLWIGTATLGLVGVVLGLGEVLQPFTGRTASLGDLAVGLGGAVAGLALFAARSGTGVPRAALLTLAATIFLLPVLRAGVTLYDIDRQEEAFPLLASFEDRLELTRWSANDADVEPSRRHVTHGEASLRITLRPAPYPGVSMVWPPHDWRGHEALALDVWLGGDVPVDLLLKVEDRVHASAPAFRSLLPLHLEPGANALHFPLEAIRTGARGGLIDVRQVAGFTIMAVDLRTPLTIWIDAVRLEGDIPES